MRLLKFLFTLSSALTSFMGVLYLFHRYQASDTHHFDEFDSERSSTEAVSSEKSELSEVYYRSMDPEEISESN